MSTTNGAAAAAAPWADGPCPLIHTPVYETKKDDIWTKGATHMALLHNAILRGFNSIYLQAPHVQTRDYQDFIGYSLAWYELVRTHSEDEEKELFPKVEAVLGKTGEGLWEETLAEHESFHQGLQAFHTYLTSLSISPQSFSGTKLVSIMDSFLHPFTLHFHSEISTIASFASLPYAPTPNSEGEKQAALTFKTWGKKTLLKAGMTQGVPFALLNMDAEFEGGMWENWPPMPGMVRWMLVNVFGSWNWGWWRFSSCDSGGRRRVLFALGDGVVADDGGAVTADE